MDGIDVSGIGSSPLARGAQVVASLIVAAGGIIPARAGSTPDKSLRLFGRWDHPRSRGEH